MVGSYTVKFTNEAASDLARLDKPIAKRIIKKIKWMSQNFEVIAPIPLHGDLKNKYKLVVGDWRVIYDLNVEPLLIVILFVGHRSDVYK